MDLKELPTLRSRFEIEIARIGFVDLSLEAELRGSEGVAHIDAGIG